MTTHYDGRHRGGVPAETAGRRQHHPAGLVRRPLISLAVATALVGVSAVGYAKAGDLGSSAAASFTIPRVAIAQGADQHAEVAEQQQYRAGASLQSSLAASAAHDAVQAAAAAEAARLAAERQQAQDRAARDAQRQSLVANAQANPRGAARAMLAGFGWADGQFGCLDSLWTKESGWNFRASNASSGAYGIPQSLPGSKMGTVAADWRTNPTTQITWGLQYIKASYGSPCSAWGHSQSVNWY